MADRLDTALGVLRHGLRLGQCPGCAATTPLSHLGHDAYCQPCTLGEIGVSYLENAARINSRRSLSSWLKDPATVEDWMPRYSRRRMRLEHPN